MRNHHIAVIELINIADAFSAEAIRLRAEIATMEQRDPTLIVQRIDLFAAHTTPIGGEVLPAERKPEGILLT